MKLPVRLGHRQTAYLSDTCRRAGNPAKPGAPEIVATAWLPAAGQVAYTRQPRPLGPGHAVWFARHLVGAEPFAVVLVDVLMVCDPHGYILYVGITGDDESESNLHRRFGQYLRHLEHGTGRPAIVYMLENWAGYLSFYFCSFGDRKVSLSRIERNFINAIIPPINKRDMDAEITAVKAAAF